jgi:hypothetical protein
MTIRVEVLVSAQVLVGCATAPQKPWYWQRVDGKPFSDAQLQADTAFCDGEVSKAGLSDTARASRNYGIGAAIYADQALQRIQVGCMGGRGYILVQG